MGETRRIVTKIVTPDLEKSYRKRTDGPMKQIIETATRQIKNEERANLTISQKKPKGS